jgi:hypothetical protein
VSFKVELALECFVDRLDDLAQWPEEPGSGALGLALSGRAQQAQAAGLPAPRDSDRRQTLSRIRSSPCRAVSGGSSGVRLAHLAGSR